jgi:hypothetical protein
MNSSEVSNLSQLVEKFQLGGERVARYEGNPYVIGDNIAEHIARGVRLISYISTELEREYPSERDLVRDILTTFIIHDDDEIIDGVDIATFKKNHNIKDEDEVEAFTKSIESLPQDSFQRHSQLFQSFRNKDTLASRIAKQIDNVVGNQLVVEQKAGVIAPISAKFAIEYVRKVRDLSGSEIIGKLIDSQIESIMELRRKLLHNQKELKSIIQKYIHDGSYDIDLEILLERATQLLEVNLEEVSLEVGEVGKLLQDY